MMSACIIYRYGRLSDDEVLAIIDAENDGTPCEVAKRYGVRPSTIRRMWGAKHKYISATGTNRWY